MSDPSQFDFSDEEPTPVIDVGRMAEIMDSLSAETAVPSELPSCERPTRRMRPLRPTVREQ